jgi:hypothetical protein
VSLLLLRLATVRKGDLGGDTSRPEGPPPWGRVVSRRAVRTLNGTMGYKRSAIVNNGERGCTFVDAML